MDHKRTFRLTVDEEKKLIEEMSRTGEKNFSNFIRQKLFHSFPQVSSDLSESFLKETVHETVRILEKESRENQMVSKLETIFLTLYRIQIVSETTNQVAHDHMKQLLVCVREMMLEVDRLISLSEEFKEKWL